MENFQVKNIHDVKNMNNTIEVEDLHSEELHGEMIYIFEDGGEGSIGESRSDSVSKEKIGENIVESNEEVGSKENFERNKGNYNQGNACMNDDAIHGHGVKRRNSNIMGRCRCNW